MSANPFGELLLGGDRQRGVAGQQLSEGGGDRPVLASLGVRGIVGWVDCDVPWQRFLGSFQAVPQLARPRADLTAQVRPTDGFDEDEIPGENRRVAYPIRDAALGVSRRVHYPDKAPPEVDLTSFLQRRNVQLARSSFVHVDVVRWVGVVRNLELGGERWRPADVVCVNVSICHSDHRRSEFGRVVHIYGCIACRIDDDRLTVTHQEVRE